MHNIFHLPSKRFQSERGEDDDKDCNNTLNGSSALQIAKHTDRDRNSRSIYLDECSYTSSQVTKASRKTLTNYTLSPASVLVDLLPLQKIAPGASNQNLYKFYCFKKTTEERIKTLQKHLNWRSENAWIYNPPLRADSDPILKTILLSETVMQPKGMIDKQGRPCLLFRLRNNDMTDGRTPLDFCRCAFYNIERLLQRKETLENGVCLVNDLGGITKNNFNIGVPKLLFSVFSGGTIPIRVKRLIFLNPPLLFSVIFMIVKSFMLPKIRKRIVVVKSFKEISDFIDSSKLLEEDGGEVKHNQMEWLEEQIVQEQTEQSDLLENIVSSRYSAETNSS